MSCVGEDWRGSCRRAGINGCTVSEGQSRIKKNCASVSMVIVTSDRAFAGAQSYTIDELLEYRWILCERGSGTRDALLSQASEKGQILNVFMEPDHIESIKDVLKNPGTLSCLSQHSIVQGMPIGLLYPVQVKDIL